MRSSRQSNNSSEDESRGQETDRKEFQDVSDSAKENFFPETTLAVIVGQQQMAQKLQGGVSSKIEYKYKL